MHVVRRLSLLVTAFTLGTAVLLGVVTSRPTVSSNAAKSLASATHYFDSTVVLARNARPRGSRGDQLAIALGYLERLRVGLGSPFRLVNEALVDPRLDHAMSARVAWALLGRLRRGEAYIIDPASLDGSGPWTPDGHGATGAAHVAFIERAVHSASDPRVGELAIRLTYSIESAKGTLAPSTVGVAAQVAALVRDRELAMADVRDLLVDANDARRDVMSLTVERRAAHAFRVEQPTLAPLAPELQVEAMNAVPALLAVLDTLDRVDGARSLAVGTRASLMNAFFADRLEELGSLRPPLAQVGVTLNTRGSAVVHATNDETLAASNASVLSVNDSTSRANSLAVLAAAVAMRTLAQDTPWFLGDSGPNATDLMAEFGLADVAFTRSVPPLWRPYYLRELEIGLRDMQLVLPAFSPNGLRIRFGNEALRDSALAMHEPRTRTLQLSIATSAGTLAHELSHDLDWQAARRLFADGGGYSTDRAVRESRTALATSVKGLAEARVLRPAGVAGSAAGGRPAELFARGADWFVASALAQFGRTNGFLSVAQDGWLTGYAAGLPAVVGSAGAGSLLSAIGEMTYLPDSIRVRFEAQWSDPRVVDPSLLVRRVLETPIVFRNGWQRSGAAAAIVAATHPRFCVADESAETTARQRLLMLAVDARARGIAARRMRFRPITVSPEESDRLRDAVRSAIISELTTALHDQGLVPLVPAIFRSSPASCSTIAR